MLQAQTTESKQPAEAARTAAAPEPQRTLHPPVLQRALGNQAMLRMLSRSTPAIQTKLTINQPGDRHEQEADRVAEQVMRMPDPVAAPKFHASPRGAVSLQRKCAECEEEEKVQRKQTGGDTSGSAVAPPIVHDVLNSPGQPLDTATRGFFEPRFGQDFSSVRVHTNSAAAASSRDVQALAYTVGKDIVFGQGQFNPTTDAGRRLLAHELTHTVQQSRVGRSALQRFASDEHVKIGDLAEPGKQVSISGYGRVRLGELIAMAGDYFESISELESVAKQGTFGKEQIDLVRWKVNGGVGPKPTVGSGVEAAVNARFEELASRNQTHFSTGSSPGQSNREQYIDLHTQAIRAGFVAGAFAIGQTPTFPQHIPEALEGFAEHFLTDAFSAGHVRTPRGELQTYWSAKFPSFGANLLDFIACNMATYIHDVDHPSQFGIALPVSVIKDGALGKPGLKDTLKSKAGSKWDRFGLGDLISVALHDADNAGGLDVVSPSDTSGSRRPFKWHAVGDSNLFPATANPVATTTQNMVEQAVKLSFEEVREAIQVGEGIARKSLSQMTNPASFRALPLIPSEDTSSTTNPTFSWRVNDVRSLPTNLKDVIRNEFKPGATVLAGLSTVNVDPCAGSIHSAAAWECFKQVLVADPIDALIRISEGKTCPTSNPCPSLAPTNTCP